jgi:hypothetical protein
MNINLTLTGVAFVVVTVVFYGLVIRQLSKALSLSGWTHEKQQRIRRETVLVLAGWALVLAILSLTGIAGNFDLFPANAAPILLIPLIGCLFVVFSGKTRHLLQFIPESTIINLNIFRLFVEILLWMLFIQNLTPVQMTFEGRNFDVLTAITAPLAAWLFAGKKWALIGWNILGLCLLINIVAIALLSMPTPYRIFNNEPANTIVLTWPFILLPGMLVPLAYYLHFLSIRQLSLRKHSTVG